MPTWEAVRLGPQALANELLGYSAEKLSKATEAGELDEVSNHA